MGATLAFGGLIQGKISTLKLRVTANMILGIVLSMPQYY